MRLIRLFPLAFAAWLALGTFAQASKKPHIVFVTGDHEYSSEETMPALARELERRYEVRCTVLRSAPDENSEENIPGLEALADADLAVLFLRWRRLPPEQLAHLEKYLASGKPLVAFRTTTHAFNYPKGHPLERWNAFAAEYLGAPPGWGNGHYHYGHKSSTDVVTHPGAKNHPALKGVAPSFHVRSWLYHVLPNYPPPDAQVLLVGKSVEPDKKDAVENPVAWTWTNKAGGKVWMTTLGHPEDFRTEAVQRLVVNGIHWALGKPAPEKWLGKMNINATYHGIRMRNSEK